MRINRLWVFLFFVFVILFIFILDHKKNDDAKAFIQSAKIKEAHTLGFYSGVFWASKNPSFTNELVSIEEELEKIEE
jgi:hypothetical protein